MWALVHPHDRAGVEEYLEKSPNDHLRVTFVPETGAGPELWGHFEYTRYVLWQRSALGYAVRLHRDQVFDVVHHVSWGTVSSAPSLWKLGAPFVWGPLGGGQASPRAFRGYYGRAWAREIVRNARLRALPYLHAPRAAARRCAAALATNHETADLLRRLGARDVTLFLDSGVRSGDFPTAPPQRKANPELRLLWAGALVPRKALTLALDSLSLLEDLPWRLSVAGDGPMRQRWEERAAELGLTARVEFLGSVGWDRMPALYRDSDVFLFTSLRDAFGGVMLEAMTQGLPVVTLDHQGARAFVPAEASIKVPVTTPEQTAQALATAIRGLYDSPERRLKMGEAAWQLAKTQTWDRRAARMTEIYERVVQESQASKKPSRADLGD